MPRRTAEGSSTYGFKSTAERKACRKREKAKEKKAKHPKKSRVKLRMLGSKQKWMTRAEAVAAVHAGEKQNAVAKRFGVTRQAVSQWVKAAAAKGHGLRHLTELERRKIRKKAVAMVKSGGISQAATARKFGISELSVGKWVKLFEEGGVLALDVVHLDEEEEQGQKRRYHRDRGRKEAKQFMLRFNFEERPVRIGQAEGQKIGENFIGKTVACHRHDHEVVGAYFDAKLGIVLSYVYVPIDEDG